jgi:hypothetical protein
MTPRIEKTAQERIDAVMAWVNSLPDAWLIRDPDGQLATFATTRPQEPSDLLEILPLYLHPSMPVVKALTWEPHFYAKTDELVSLTADLPGREEAYKIETVTANINFRLFIEGREVKPATGWYWPFDDAKAAAQSDYETRIRSALESSAPVKGEESK